MKTEPIKREPIARKQPIEIHPMDNGYRITAGCKEFVCTESQFIPVMVHYSKGEYEKALKILGVEVVDTLYKAGGLEHWINNSGASVPYGRNYPPEEVTETIDKVIDKINEAAAKAKPKRGRPRKVVK